MKILYKQAEVVPSAIANVNSTPQPQSEPPRPACTLSVSADEMQIPGIPEATVQGIWSKAAAIVSKPDAIVNAPDSMIQCWLRVKQESDHTLLLKRVLEDSHVTMDARCGCLPAYVYTL